MTFTEAIQKTAVREIMPTNLSSAGIAQLSSDVRDRSFFSARTTNAVYLQKMKDMILKLLAGGSSPGKVRSELRGFLEELNYKPEKPGTIEDLGTDQRLDLILKTQTEMAKGFGHWKQGQSEVLLDEFPAQELFRAEDREEPRDWPERWEAAGGEFFDGPADYQEGRMIALKTSPVWSAISEFGLPYPPFDYNSGMEVRDIARDEAEELGLIAASEQLDPDEDSFADTATGTDGLDDDMLEALVRTAGGVLREGTLALVKGALR